MAIAVLLATGIAMASHYSRWEDDTLKAKLAVLVLVAVLTGLHIASPQSRALSSRLRRRRSWWSGSGWCSRTDRRRIDPTLTGRR